MELLSREDLKSLAAHHGRPSVSIYLPMHRAAVPSDQDWIRMRNLVRRGAERLKALGHRDGDIQSLLGPARALLDDRPYWLHPADGLAAFASPGRFQAWRLPIALPELVTVNEGFYLKPLLPLFADGGRFFLLALSQNEVRFFRCARHDVIEPVPAKLPHGLNEALKYDLREKQLQVHSGSPRGGGKASAVFHGNGVGSDDTKDRILRYFREVDRALHPVLREEHAPLVLAAVEYLFPIYREANTYPHLVPGGLAGNPDGRRAEDLYRRGAAGVRP